MWERRRIDNATIKRWVPCNSATDPVLARAYDHERLAAELPWWRLRARHLLRRAAADDRAYARSRNAA